MSVTEYPTVLDHLSFQLWSRNATTPRIGIATPLIGVETVFPGFADDADVHRRVVHVVLDALAVHELQPDDVVLAVGLRFELKFRPQPVALPLRSNWSSSMSSQLIFRSAPATRT